LHEAPTNGWKQKNLLISNNTFLELGSGLGRSGILAWHCLNYLPNDESKRLYLTDGDTDVLTQLRHNVQQNIPSEAFKSKEEADSVHLACAQLLWGRERAFCFRSHIGHPVDVIFGSDLVYVQQNILPLFETVVTLLSASGSFLMAHCDRREGNEVTVDMVLEVAESHRMQYRVLEQEDDITLFCFTWSD
jgi:hypothetical protein